MAPEPENRVAPSAEVVYNTPSPTGGKRRGIREREPMGNSRMVIEDYAGVTVVTFSDSSILDSTVIEQLGRDLYELTDKQNKQKIILDFTNVKFLSSQVLGVLLTLNKKSQAIKGTLVLCSMKPELKKIFTITNLDKLFKFYKDDGEALGSFGVNLR